MVIPIKGYRDIVYSTVYFLLNLLLLFCFLIGLINGVVSQSQT